MGDVQFAKTFMTTLDGKSTKYPPDHVFDPKTFQTRIPYTLPKLPHPPHPLPPKSTPSAPPPPGAEPSPSSTTINLILKSSRNPSMTLTLPSVIPATTTIQSLKEQIQSHLGGNAVVSVDKIKVLANKKPIPASKKTVADALDGVGVKIELGGSVEFGVMVMGGAPDPPPQQTVPATTTTAPQSLSPDAGEAAAVAASAPESEKAAAEADAARTQQPVPSVAAAGSGPMEGVEKTLSQDTPTGKEVLRSAEFWTDLQGFLEQRLRDADEAVRLRDVFEKAWRSSESTP